MDPLAARAAEDYHRLLRDDEALVEELEARFFERMRDARLTFGGRVLCAFPRPNFVAPADYDAIRGVCRDIFAAIEKVESRLGEDLWDRVDLTPEERELVRLDPGLSPLVARRRGSTRSSRPRATGSWSSTRRAPPASPTTRCWSTSSWSCR